MRSTPEEFTHKVHYAAFATLPSAFFLSRDPFSFFPAFYAIPMPF